MSSAERANADDFADAVAGQQTPVSLPRADFNRLTALLIEAERLCTAMLQSRPRPPLPARIIAVQGGIAEVRRAVREAEKARDR